jgi:hypothetical protein
VKVKNNYKHIVFLKTTGPRFPKTARGAVNNGMRIDTFTLHDSFPAAADSKITFDPAAHSPRALLKIGLKMALVTCIKTSDTSCDTYD